MRTSRSALIAYLAAASSLFFCDIALAQLPHIPVAQKLKLPPDPAPQWSGAPPDEQVHFGSPVATDGKTVIVSVTHGRAAYAYVKRPNGKWVFQDDLPAPEGRVGAGAAVFGDVALVQGDIDNQYVVFVFKRSAGHWAHTQTLPGGYELGGYNFLALGTDFAAIGKPYIRGPDGLDVNVGTVEMYDSVGTGSYIFDTSLSPGGGDPSWQMGYEPKVEGNTLVVATPGNAEVNVFVRTGGVWSEQAHLIRSIEGGSALFANEIFGFSANRVVLTTVFQTETTPGSPQVFTRHNRAWAQDEAIAHPYDAQAHLENFATMDGKRLLLADQGGNRVFLFERQGGSYVPVAELAPAPQPCTSEFEYQALRLLVKGRTAFATCSNRHTQNPRFEGEVRVYELPPLQSQADE